LAEFGYAGEILKVDLSDRKTTKLPTADYAERFMGGRGLATKLYWDMVPPETRASDPDNCLICVSGPVAGFTGLAGFRWQACGKSASLEPEAFSYANLGGSWGGRLKFAGYDGLAVQGKSDKPVYLFIHDDAVEIRDASHFWGRPTFEVIDSLKAELGKKVSVLTIGPAAENLVTFSTLFADQGASGSAGLGSIMGSKMLKAIAVAGDRRPKAADPDRLKGIVDRVSQPIRTTGPMGPWVVSPDSKPQICYGCGSGCSRLSYRDESGKLFKSFCQQTEIYQVPAREYYGDGIEAQLLAMRLCDGYGLNTFVMQTRKISLREGFGDLLAQGIIKATESIGGKAKELISKTIATRANEKKDYDPRLMPHTAMLYATEPRRPTQQLHKVSGILMMWVASQGGGGMMRMGPPFTYENLLEIAKRYWGGELAADFSTYEGKALAAKKVQDRTYAIESMILCDLKWPMTTPMTSEDRAGDSSLESQIYSAITGRNLNEEGLLKIGERIFNLQRAILLRQGWGGREGDKLLDYFHEVPLQDELFYNPNCIAPGKDGKVISRKGAVVDREEFEKMKSEYYELRRWDVASGLPTETKLKELELEDISGDLKEKGLLA